MLLLLIFLPLSSLTRHEHGKLYVCASILLFLEDDSAVKDIPAEKRKERKIAKTVRKIQKVTELPGPDSKQGEFQYCF